MIISSYVGIYTGIFINWLPNKNIVIFKVRQFIGKVSSWNMSIIRFYLVLVAFGLNDSSYHQPNNKSPNKPPPQPPPQPSQPPQPQPPQRLNPHIYICLRGFTLFCLYTICAGELLRLEYISNSSTPNNYTLIWQLFLVIIRSSYFCLERNRFDCQKVQVKI